MCGVKKHNLLVDLDERPAALKEIIVVSTKYVIILKDRALGDIMRKDSEAEEVDQELWGAIGLLDGVIDVDYDGHFGNNIYIEIDIEHDTKDTWKLICGLINKYV